MKTSKDCLITLFFVGKSNILFSFDRHKASSKYIFTHPFLIKIHSISIIIKYFICSRYTNYFLLQVKFYSLNQLCFRVHSISHLVYSFGEFSVIVFFFLSNEMVPFSHWQTLNCVKVYTVETPKARFNVLDSPQLSKWQKNYWRQSNERLTARAVNSKNTARSETYHLLALILLSTIEAWFKEK